jgi:hypothetical protein
MISDRCCDMKLLSVGRVMIGFSLRTSTYVSEVVFSRSSGLFGPNSGRVAFASFSQNLLMISI